MSIDGGLPPGCTDRDFEFDSEVEDDVDERPEVDGDVEQAQAMVALITRLKQENFALAADNEHLRLGWTSRGAELEAMAKELDGVKRENGTLRAELNHRVKVAQEALASLFELGSQYRPPAGRSHIDSEQPLPRAVQRGPASPQEQMERRPRLIEGLRAAISGE
jgi:hypothetical protein